MDITGDSEEFLSDNESFSSDSSIASFANLEDEGLQQLPVKSLNILPYSGEPEVSIYYDIHTSIIYVTYMKLNKQFMF